MNTAVPKIPHLTIKVAASSIQDVLWVEPLIRSLAEKIKKITFISPFPSVFLGYPIKHVQIKSRTKGWDAIRLFLASFLKLDRRYLFLDTTRKSNNRAHHILELYKATAGEYFDSSYPRIHLSPAEKQNYALIKPYVVISHGQRKAVQSIFGIDWRFVYTQLESWGYQLIILGASDGASTAYHYEKLSLRDTFSIIFNASLFIGPDGPEALAAASFKIPSILFFGQENPWLSHLEPIYTGVIMQQPCVFPSCYNRYNFPDKKNAGPLPQSCPSSCCLHRNVDLIRHIERMIEIRRADPAIP